MKSWLSVGCIAVAICTGVACGDDTPAGSGGSAGTGGSGGSSGSGGSGGSGGGGDDGGLGEPTVSGCVTTYANDKITYTGTAAPAYTCDGNKSAKYPTGPNACRNTSDCDIINTGKVRELVKSCALGCLGETDCAKLAACNAMCVKDETAKKIMMPGITDACGACYTAISQCSSLYCLSECISNADAIECVKCQFAYGCRTPFERCSGLDRQ
jgi:hypothetical protein